MEKHRAALEEGHADRVPKGGVQVGALLSLGAYAWVRLPKCLA